MDILPKYIPRPGDDVLIDLANRLGCAGIFKTIEYPRSTFGFGSFYQISKHGMVNYWDRTNRLVYKSLDDIILNFNKSLLLNLPAGLYRPQSKRNTWCWDVTTIMRMEKEVLVGRAVFFGGEYQTVAPIGLTEEADAVELSMAEQNRPLSP